jgi:hypothetical protein
MATAAHGGSFGGFRALRKPRCAPRGAGAPPAVRENGEQPSWLFRSPGFQPGRSGKTSTAGQIQPSLKSYGGEVPAFRNRLEACPPVSDGRAARASHRARRGMVLVEATLSLSILTVIGLLLLKLSLNILHPRQWVLQQTVTDAYMTYERAFAERIPFETLIANDSPWPAHPTTNTSVVEIGRLPGNRPITGVVTRTRFADTGNYPIDGGSGTVATNPAAMKVWKAQSVLTYQIGSRSYAKSRTVLRSQ